MHSSDSLWWAAIAPTFTRRSFPVRRTLSVTPLGVTLCLLLLLAVNVHANEAERRQSGWELSIANGMLVFKQETITESQGTQSMQSNALSGETEQSPVEPSEPIFLLANESQFTTRVSGIVARTTLTQTFRNPGEHWLDGRYQFPLPEDAAVDSLKMRVGARDISGQIQEKQAAERQFQQARQNGKKASLVSHDVANLFTTAVANIGPYEEIQIEIQFQHKVRYLDGEFHLRLPSTFIPRFGEQALDEQGQGDNSIDLPEMSGSQAKLDFSIELSAAAELAYLKNPHFPVIKERAGNRWYLQSESGQTANKDIELVWAYKNHTPQLLHFNESRADAEYGLLMILPGQKAPETVVPRDITFVIDTSSSMAGQAIKQAKSALSLAIEQLRVQDRFNIIEFNSEAKWLWPSMQLVSARSLSHAQDFVQRLEAKGGTNVYAALDSALQVQSSSEALQQLVFITDGAIGYEDTLLSELENRLGDIRLFTVGIGAAPNSYFMVEAAKAGRGSYTYIASQEQVQERMLGLFSKLTLPVLRDIQLDLGQPAERYPARIPDLYQGEPLVVSYKSAVPVTDIRVTARAYPDSWQQSLPATLVEEHAGVVKHWAGEKIRDLLRAQRIRHASTTEEAQQIKQEIIATALTHELVSPYTSLVAIDDDISRRQHLSLPLMSRMPATALGTERHFISALLLLLIASLLTFWHARDAAPVTSSRSYDVSS